MVVMNDNARRGPEWRRLVAEFFVPRLGGDRTAWETANRDVFEDLFKNFVDPGPGDMDYVSWIEEYQKRWLRGMAEAAGVQFSSDDAYCLKLSYEATDYVTRREARAEAWRRRIGRERPTGRGGLGASHVEA